MEETRKDGDFEDGEKVDLEIKVAIRFLLFSLRPLEDEKNTENQKRESMS